MDNISEKGIETNKNLLNFINLFMRNKSMIANNYITFIDRTNVITDEYEISKTFNKYYISIVEKSWRNKPNQIGITPGSLNDSDVIDRIIESYQNHSSVLRFKTRLSQT